MKQFNHLFIILVAFMAFGMQATAQVCDLDSTGPATPGLYPTTLPQAQIDVLYDEVINVVIPKDTTIKGDFLPAGLDSISLDICSLTIDSVKNLPDGLSFECNVPDCIFEVSHDSGFVNRGCVRITGTPTTLTTDDDSITIFVHVDVGQYNPDSGFCETVTIPFPSVDSLRFFTYVTEIVVSDSTTSVDDMMEQALNMRVFPNPTSGFSSLSFELMEAEVVEIEVFDMVGRKVQYIDLGRSAPGAYQIPVGDSNLNKGLYLVNLKLNHGESVISRKLIVQ